MGELKDALLKAGLPKITFSPRSICKVKDGVINLPDDEENRQLHDFRSVLIMSGSEMCDTRPIVTVAPLSTVMNWGTGFEVVLKPNKYNQLLRPSRVMLAHIQPLRKGEIEQQFGTVTDDEWEEIMERLVGNFEI